MSSTKFSVKWAFYTLFSYYQAVTIDIGEFDVQGSEQCAKDYLELSDPSNDKSVKLCDQDGTGFKFITSGNVATVTFHSDSSITGKGFSLTYGAVNVEPQPPVIKPPGNNE